MWEEEEKKKKKKKKKIWEERQVFQDQEEEANEAHFWPLKSIQLDFGYRKQLPQRILEFDEREGGCQVRGPSRVE